MDTTVTGTSAPRGKTPGTRTSCQSEWILQISTESKYLPGSDTHFCNMDWCLNLCWVHRKIFMNSLLHLHFKSSRFYKCSFVNSWSTWWNPRSPSRTGRPRLAGRTAPSSGVEASWASRPPTARSRRTVPTGSSAAVIWSRKQVFNCSKLSDSKKKWIMYSSHQFIITSKPLNWTESNHEVPRDSHPQIPAGSTLKQHRKTLRLGEILERQTLRFSHQERKSLNVQL